MPSVRGLSRPLSRPARPFGLAPPRIVRPLLAAGLADAFEFCGLSGNNAQLVPGRLGPEQGTGGVQPKGGDDCLFLLRV